MDSSVIVAIIAGITSIAVALIQMTTSLRMAGPKKSQVQVKADAVPVEAQVSAPERVTGSYRAWLVSGAILLVTNILAQLYLRSPYSGFLQFGSALWCTCLLAYFRPIRWAYVAGAVALINLASILMSTLQSGAWNNADLTRASIFYMGNAIVATGIAFFRMRDSRAK